MFNSMKIIMTCGYLLISLLMSYCYASESIDTLIAMEEGSQNNIQVQHQMPLQQEFFQQFQPQITSTNICEEVRARITEDLDGKNILLENKEKLNSLYSVCKNIKQFIYDFSSLPMVKEYVTQVAASVTSALIVYEVYKTFSA